jgi:hypothetical protein
MERTYFWNVNLALAVNVNGSQVGHGGETIGEEHGGHSLQQKGGWLNQWFAIATQENTLLEPLSYDRLDLVSEYSRLHLTQESDRMPAISGLAVSFCGKALESYVAGIWDEDPARGLLFVRLETSDADPERAKSNSKKGKVEMDP